ncbi:response regulator [Lysobacter sp. CA196]|uniref:response regulator n=1 Tax=Lysobacter sp. CA196 TaxID=3455606 RepID=UPI003F8D2042
MHFPLSGVVEAAAQPTVLLVDDDENILDVVQDSLRDAGYAVITAANGAQALQILTEDAGRVDVVFSDVSMPGGMSGIDLAKHAYEVRPALWVILTSGYSPNWLPELPLNCEFLPKPYEMSDLDRRLRRKRHPVDQAAPSP